MAKRRKFTDQLKAKVALAALRGVNTEGPTEAKVKAPHAKIGRLAVENDCLTEGLKR
jgi:hypothetical protein